VGIEKFYQFFTAWFKELEWGCSRNLGPCLLPCVLLVRVLGFKEANCTNLAIILSLIITICAAYSNPGPKF
jgi:hypothetical protein